ncbi:hypothetical protein CSB37_01045 [bacterium DOLZORAL124_38_8]|nr:MAG: hypothetical protein CSB37_01045 [bacterium DOLZORAL124_38_8]
METISPYILPVLVGLVVLIVLVSAIVWFKKRKKSAPKVTLIGPLSPEKEAQAQTVAQHIESYLAQGFDIKEMRLQAAAQEIDMDIWERAEEIVALKKQ